jgi:putative phosphoesterase
VHIVAGNCDYGYDLPAADTFMVGDYTVMACHGHNFYVHGSTKYLKEYARDNGIDVVMFGHTHRPYIEIEEDVVILNPGSISYPRQEDRRQTFLIMEIDDMGDAHFAHGVYNPAGF